MKKKPIDEAANLSFLEFRRAQLEASFENDYKTLYACMRDGGPKWHYVGMQDVLRGLLLTYERLAAHGEAIELLTKDRR